MENINTKKFQLKRGFLFSLIVSLSISALVAIFIFLFGDFEKTQVQILYTTLAIGGYSLAGFCNSILYEKKGYYIFTRLGIIVSIVGLIFTVLAIWDLLYSLDMIRYSDLENFWKIVLSFAILSISFAHASLLLISDKISKVVGIILYTTLFFIAALSIALIVVLFSEGIGDFYLRLIGVFAVLDVLGTILFPIFRKIIKVKSNNDKL